MARSSFADGLVALDMRETRARLAEAMAAVKAHPRWAEGAALQEAMGRVERKLLTSARGAIQILDEALQAADFRPAPATLAEAHAQIVDELDADAPPPPVRQSPPPSHLGARRVQVPPPRPRLPPRP